MKKIIIIISVLVLGVAAVTWLYFKKLATSEYSTERIFSVVPENASLIFEYKNEDSFYQIFKDFSLFGDILGKKTLSELTALKEIFIDNPAVSTAFTKTNLFFSLHQTKKNNAELLIIAPFAKDANLNADDFINNLKTKYHLTQGSDINQPVYQITFSNHSLFHFIIYRSLLVGSFDKDLVLASKNRISTDKGNTSFKADFKSPRNKNSIANLYINFSKLPALLNNYSSRKNPSETFALKDVDAFAALNINYQNDAFMFSGITTVNEKSSNYFKLFLSQEPGNSTLKNIIPYDAANYSFFYVSDLKKFKTGLDALFIKRKEAEKIKKQLDNITQKHSINIEKELFPVLGHEFGVVQLASGDKIGLIKTNNTNRLSFLLSTISTETDNNIRHFDDSFLLYSFFGDPFNFFNRPYYTIIENHLIVANNVVALRQFLQNYNEQKFLNRTDKNLEFQQYLSNQGNIFYFIHNSNSKAVIKSFLSADAYKNFKSTDFDWTNVYGLSIQFSADKDKFFTNLFMSKMPKSEKILPTIDSLLIDSLSK